MKIPWFFLFRILASLLLLAAILYQFATPGLIQNILSCDPNLFFAAIGLYLVGQLLNAVRWQLMLRSLSDTVPHLRDLFALIMAGVFCNFFLPSTIGGDVVRAEIAQRHIGSRGESYASIIVTRLIALAAILWLAILAGLFIVFGYDTDFAPLWRLPDWLPAMGLFGVLALLSAILYVGFSSQLTSRFRNSLTDFVELVGRCFRNRQAVLASFLLAILSNFIGQILVVWVLALGLDMDLHFSDHLFAMPFIILASMAPITINGIGVRDAAFIFFYVSAASSVDAILSLSILFTAVLVFLSLLGGTVLLFRRYSPFASD